MSGFDRLRVGVIAGAVGTVLVPALAPQALAAGHITFRSSRGFDAVTFGGIGPSIAFSRFAGWSISNSAPWPTNSAIKAYGIGSAFRATTVFCSGSPCSGTNTGRLVDPLDAVTIDGFAFQNPDGTVVKSGPTITSDTRTLRGLKTNVRQDFLGFDEKGNNIVRVLVTMRNTSANTRIHTIDVGSNLKSDGSTSIAQTSDGDNNYEHADAWALFAATGMPTPAYLLAKGDADKGTVKHDPSAGPDGAVVDEYVVKVKPQSTVRLLYFAVIGPLIPQGNTRTIPIVHHFDNGISLQTNNLLAGLSRAVLKQVVNWTGLT